MSNSMKILIVPPPCLKTITGKETPEGQEKTRQLFIRLMELSSRLWSHFLTWGQTDKVELLKIGDVYQDANDFYGATITIILNPGQTHKNILLQAFWRLPTNRLEIGIKLADDKNEIKRDQGFPATNAEEAAKAILNCLFSYFNRESTSLARFAEDLIPDKK